MVASGDLRTVTAERDVLLELFACVRNRKSEELKIAWSLLRDRHVNLLEATVDMLSEWEHFLDAGDFVVLVLPLSSAEVNQTMLRKLEYLKYKSPFAQTRQLALEVLVKLQDR
eukprot:CFRG0806T1